METIKEEKKADFEQLLNRLIEKGWKPFDVKGISEYFFESVPVGLYRLCWKKPDYDYNVYSKRELVSKESGLWQFVCENEMILKHIEKICVNPYNNDGRLRHEEYAYKDYQYWIMSCSLKDESELEDFLLSNIKVDVESK